MADADVGMCGQTHSCLNWPVGLKGSMRINSFALNKGKHETAKGHRRLPRSIHIPQLRLRPLEKDGLEFKNCPHSVDATAVADAACPGASAVQLHDQRRHNHDH